MLFLLSTFGSFLAASGTVPYLLATMRGEAKPRLVTWSTWCILTGAASIAAFSVQQLEAGIFAGLGSLSTGLVVLCGVRYGDRSLKRLDVVCLASVMSGLWLWLISGQAVFGVWTAIVVDFIGLLPTLSHAWQSPHEETAVTYMLVSIGGLLTVVPVIALNGRASVVAIGYPLYAAVSLGCTALLIRLRRLYVTPPLAQVVVQTTDTERSI